jgi:ATP phosphoribosyltransferase
MPVTIALPKGKLGEDAEKAMIQSGILGSVVPKDSRRLIFDMGQDIRVLLVRAWDVPTYVEMGAVDLGVCGKDDLVEHDADVLELLDMDFGHCKMCVAANKHTRKEELFSRSFVRVATKYPNIAKKFFSTISVQAEVIKLYGSVELASVTGLSDCIVDIVSSGGTLRENGLEMMQEIFESTARLVANRSSYYRNLDTISRFVTLLTK